MPFLTNLKNQSLYWNRCFTLGERSFAVVPSLTGSLPYGKMGFTLMDKLPNHLTLVSILEKNNYQTSFFYGQGAWFHRKEIFFGKNNIDLIFDNNKFSEKYEKIIVGDDNYFGGYNDKDLFNQSLEVIDTLPQNKRLDIYFTGSSHSPFAIADNSIYDKKLSEILKSVKSNDDKKFYSVNKKYIKSILFVNDALDDFFTKYKKRPEFKNTIFIITGDHPMTEIKPSNSLKRYHVPLIIYSPKLKNAQEFSQTVSHLDFYETILSFLSNYDIKIPEYSSALGSKLNVENVEKPVHLAFMNDNREIIDYYSDNYYLTGEKLYSVDKNLNLTPSNNSEMLKKLKYELNIFKKTSYHTCVNNKIISDSLFCMSLFNKHLYSNIDSSNVTEFTDEYFNLINSISIKNSKSYIDISFDYLTKTDGNFNLIYEINTTEGKQLLWKQIGIGFDEKTFQAHINLPKHNISDTIVNLKAYFWNRNKQNFKFNNLRCMVYEE